MNDAVYKFKRYEDASLNYSGISKHDETKVAGCDTVISKKEFDTLYNQPIAQPKKEEPAPVKTERMVAIFGKAGNRSMKKPLSGIVVGDLLKHNTFGMGQVIFVDSKNIVIKFACGNKKISKEASEH